MWLARLPRVQVSVFHDVVERLELGLLLVLLRELERPDHLDDAVLSSLPLEADERFDLGVVRHLTIWRDGKEGAGRAPVVRGDGQGRWSDPQGRSFV